MTLWLIRRLSQALLIILAMTVIVFAGLQMIGSPIDTLISQNSTLIEREQLIREMGFDQPLWRQYLIFLQGILQGDFGRSFVFNEPALSLIVSRFPATLELAVFSISLSVIIGIPLGLFAGLYPESKWSQGFMASSILGFSLPTFWVGLMLVMVFAIQLGWLPSSGRGDTAPLFGIEWSFLTLDGLRHLVLPGVTLALFNISMVMRLTRAGVREVLPMDYIKFARAKGLTPRRIVGVHVLKNIMIPIVTILGLDFGSTIAFTVVTESVFAWPGTGKLIVDSINLLDRPVVVSYLILVVILFVTINLITDILYKVLDPRVELESES